MGDPKKKWKLYVIQHSHTDIGYTDRQEKIERYHIDFIKQAVEAVEQIQSGVREEWEGFHWTCETFWAVERFLKQSTPEWRERFERTLKSGDIELSGNYLNMTELIGFEVLSNATKRIVDYGRTLGIEVRSAMTADVNGYSWGYAQCLSAAGIQNLFSCVHTYHGMFPLGRKQIPFWWETPNGERLLVWNGDHYHLGNELGIVPDAAHSCIIQDEFERSSMPSDPWSQAEVRIFRYLAKLEDEQYPYDFVPVMASGLITDNAPPNGKIMEFIHRWNRHHGEHIQIELTTLHAFFEELRSQSQDIPVHKGDWPDWWSDGVASTAMHTQIFRDAQRTLRLIHMLDPQGSFVQKERIGEAEYQLMLFAEHTWGYSSSVTEPWNPLVQALGVRKEAYAANAHQLVYNALDDVFNGLGETPLIPGRSMNYKVINPFSHSMDSTAQLYIDYWELPLLKDGFEVTDRADGSIVPHQVCAASRGTVVYVPVQLRERENKLLCIRPVHSPSFRTTSSFQRSGVDGVADIQIDEAYGMAHHPTPQSSIVINETCMETPFVRIGWEASLGIVSWVDKTTGEELIRKNCKHLAFVPVYEVTPVTRTEEMALTRFKMGRNRKALNTMRTAGRLVEVKQIASGPLFGMVELWFEVPGIHYYSLLLTAYMGIPRVDVTVRMHKESVWEPENVYISLPFTIGQDAPAEMWIDKMGAVLRPRVDQLPGTCTDFYCIQEGVAYLSRNRGLAIALPDTPLIQLGPLEHRQRLLQGHPQVESDDAPLYSWVLNNFWETNFKATVGGFYEFRYFIRWGEDISSPAQAMQLCRAMNHGSVSFRTSE